MKTTLIESRTIHLKDALELYNQGQYFLAHEILERQWKTDSGAVKLYFHALIQICLSLVKVFEKPNGKGARDQSERAAAKLERLLSGDDLSPAGRNEITALHHQVVQLHKHLLASMDQNEILIPVIGNHWQHLFNSNGNT